MGEVVHSALMPSHLHAVGRARDGVTEIQS